MSADFINGIGSRGPGIREAYGLGARPQVGGSGGAAGEAPPASETSPASGVEGFAPTPEAKETNQDRQAGEARASQIFSAWGPAPGTPSPSGGQLSIQGGENTAVHQVHGAQGSSGPGNGFSEATVYKQTPGASV